MQNKKESTFQEHTSPQSLSQMKKCMRNYKQNYGKIDKSHSILIVGDFSTPLLVTDRSNRQKIIKNIKLN